MKAYSAGTRPGELGELVGEDPIGAWQGGPVAQFEADGR